MAKRVLITGASGLLGRAIYSEFSSDQGWEVLGLAFSRAKGDLRKCDLTDTAAIEAIFKDFKPTFVVHAAAERRPDVVSGQKEATKKLNVDATRTICEEARKNGAPVLYISTDYVFDGKNPPYKTEDQPNPINDYGRSKLEGEVITTEASNKNMILRVPILYGEVEYIKESAVTILFEKVLDPSQRHTMCNYQRRFPTHCGDVAAVIRQLADTKLRDPLLSGIFHWSGNENMTKFDMSLCMAGVFSLSAGHIDPDNKAPVGVPRPDDTQLDTSTLQKLAIGKQTPFETGIRDVLKPFFDQHCKK